MTQSIQLSVLIPVTERYDDIAELYHEYRRALASTAMSYEVIFILDGPYPGVLDVLKRLRDQGENIKVICLAKWFGEATALNVAFSNSSGDLILTLPAYHQIEAGEIPRLISALANHDMVLARRWPRIDSRFNRLQSWVFNRLLSGLSNAPVHDAGCGARAFKRKVIEEVHIYGDLHRFLPVLAYQRGFKVAELAITQSSKDPFRRVYAPGIYLRRLLDILTVFFLVRFTKKPLRFFGLLGTGILFVGVVATLYLIAERLFFDVALANRPALLISSLFIVLGVQVMAIGLIGEIIIFTHARELKEYTIAEIVNPVAEAPLRPPLGARADADRAVAENSPG